MVFVTWMLKASFQPSRTPKYFTIFLQATKLPFSMSGRSLEVDLGVKQILGFLPVDCNTRLWWNVQLPLYHISRTSERHGNVIIHVIIEEESQHDRWKYWQIFIVYQRHNGTQDKSLRGADDDGANSRTGPVSAYFQGVAFQIRSQKIHNFRRYWGLNELVQHIFVPKFTEDLQ